MKKYVEKKRICPKCLEEVTGIYYMLAIEVPYLNMFFHMDCYNQIKNDSATLLEIITNYLQLYTKNQ
jgi:hypothetical protein